MPEPSPNRIRAYILDDEPLAVSKLRASLAAFPAVELVGESLNARAALADLAALRPDLLFLDVNMPGLTGFDLLSAIPEGERPLIVFVTAHHDRAADAFDVSAVDYLLKPFSRERLARALEKVRAALLVVGHARNDEEDCFWAAGHRERVKVPVRDLMWIEAEGDYVRFHTASGGAGRLSRATLQEMHAKLGASLFVRVHRSAIVRRSAVTAIRRKASGSMVATLSNGDEVPVGRRYFAGLRTLADGPI